MECLKCGASILDDKAVFCHECGARLDGKIPCPKCGRFIDETYAYCAFCGTTLAKTDEQPVMSENSKAWNNVFAWIRAGLGIILTVLSLVFVFMIGFQFNLTGDANILSSVGLNSTQENIKLFYYFRDAYQEIEKLKETLLFQSDMPIIGAYIHAVMGTVISVSTVACVVCFAVLMMISFIKFLTTKVENNSGKWAVRSVIAYLAGCAALGVLNFCSLNLDFTSRYSSTWNSTKMTIGFDKVTVAGIVLCGVCLALYAISNYIKQGKEWKNTKTVFNCVFGFLAAAFAAVVYFVGQNAIVGTEIGISASYTQNMKFAISQLTFASFLTSAFEPAISPFFDSQYVIPLNTSYAFAVIQEIMTLGIVACSLSAIASRIFETEGKTKGSLLFAILTAAFAVAQLITGIVSHSIMQDLYMKLLGSNANNLTTSLLLTNTIITVVFAVLQLVISIIHSTMTKTMQSCASNNDSME